MRNYCYIHIYIVLLSGILHVVGVGGVSGGGAWCPRWWCLVSVVAYMQPGTQAGDTQGYSVRRRSPSKSKVPRKENERLLLYISII